MAKEPDEMNDLEYLEWSIDSDLLLIESIKEEIFNSQRQLAQWEKEVAEKKAKLEKRKKRVDKSGECGIIQE